MDYIIAIPSAGREASINKNTMRMLRRYGIDMTRVYVFVPPDELIDYRKRFYNCNAINVIEGKYGIQAQRNYISEYFEEGQLIVEMDDDIHSIRELYITRTGTPQTPYLRCLETLILDTAELFVETGYTCAGVYPVKNKYFMKNSTSYHLSHLIGSFRIFINCKICESRIFHLLEDWETSLKYFLKDKGIIRYNNLCLLNEYDEHFYDLVLKEKMFEIMIFKEKYENYCFTRKRNDILDLQFKKKITF